MTKFENFIFHLFLRSPFANFVPICFLFGELGD